MLRHKEAESPVFISSILSISKGSVVPDYLEVAAAVFVLLGVCITSACISI